MYVLSEARHDALFKRRLMSFFQTTRVLGSNVNIWQNLRRIVRLAMKTISGTPTSAPVSLRRILYPTLYNDHSFTKPSATNGLQRLLGLFLYRQYIRNIFESSEGPSIRRLPIWTPSVLTAARLWDEKNRTRRFIEARTAQ